MTKKQKINLVRIIITIILLLILHFMPLNNISRFLLYMIPYLLIGYDILIKAIKGVANRQPFDENFLMTIATVGAIILAIFQSDDYVEAIAVMLFYQVGEWFQSYAVGKSRKNIAELMNIVPDYANVVLDNGQIEQVDPDDVDISSIIIIQPGEKIPIDGIVVEGNSSLNIASLTGESLPKEVSKGTTVLSGSINLNGVIKVQTTKRFEDSTATKILQLIEDASSNKSQSEQFITKFARVYTPIVVYLAIILAIAPPLFLMIVNQEPMWGDWIYRALTFLIISCPCALVISIPLSFFAGIGGASKKGILIKGSNYMETLTQTKNIAFDKTGTLTQGKFNIIDIKSLHMTQEDLLHLVSHVEQLSTHPIAQVLKYAYERKDNCCHVEQVEELFGYGIKATVNEQVIYVGNDKLMKRLNIDSAIVETIGTTLHIVVDGKYQGYIVVSDVIKQESIKAIKALKKEGIKRIAMLTGDTTIVAKSIGKQLGITEIYSNLLPQNKVEKVKELISQQHNKKSKLAFVGDGINDAPVLALADIGIAMGGVGSDAAIEAADVVLMDDNPYKIVQAIRLSKKCIRIVKQNIYFAIGIKILVLLLGALGLTNMWTAIFADVGVSIIAIINAIRCLNS